MHLFHDVLVEPESVHGLEDILGAALVSHQIVFGARAREREKLRILLQNSVHGEWRRNNNKIKRGNEWVLGVWTIHYHRPHLLNPIKTVWF